MIDNSIGTESSNCYVSLDEAEDYFIDRMHSSNWTSLGDDVKEQLLVTASRQIDWNIRFDGYKSDVLQSMEFPRTGIVLPDGSDLDETIIPIRLKHAVFEMALMSIKKDRTLESSLAGISSAKVSVLQVTASPGGVKSTDPKIIPKAIRNMLRDFISPNVSFLVRY